MKLIVDITRGDDGREYLIPVTPKTQKRFNAIHRDGAWKLKTYSHYIDKGTPIKLKAFDNRLLDQSAQEIIELVKKTGVKISGPVPLPTKREVYTVLRSPHVNKKSREQFQIKIHKRVIDIIDPTARTVDSLSKLSLPAGIEVEMKLG